MDTPSQISTKGLWRRVALLALLLLVLPVAATAELRTGGLAGERENAPHQRDKPYLVLVSIDGFRWDFTERYAASNIATIGERGLRAEALAPVFPALTFPNHYSIATGVPPARHGLVANKFPDDERMRWYHYKDRSTVEDGSWYLAEPIWVTAEKAGMRTAAFFFVGTEADVYGIRPTYWNGFDREVDGGQRVQQVLDWLASPSAIRPHLITLYFEDVDDATHSYGVGSAQSREAIRHVDTQIGRLLDGIASLPHENRVYVLLVSDHGTADFDPGREPLILDQLVDLNGAHVVEGGPYVWLYFDTAEETRAATVRDAVNARWDCGRALLPAEAPPEWQVTASPRFPDLMLLADTGCAVISSAARRKHLTRADHGWSPTLPEMRGVFYALGPGIPPGTRPGVLRVTDVYPLMLRILGLSPPADFNDGQNAFSPALSGLPTGIDAP